MRCRVFWAVWMLKCTEHIVYSISGPWISHDYSWLGQSWKGNGIKPQLIKKKKKKFFSLPVDKITDWHAKPIKYVFCKFRNEEKCYVKKNFYRCWMIVNVVKDVGLTPTLFFRGLLLAYIWNLCWPRIPHCSSKCNHFSLLSDLLQSLCFHQYLTAIPKDPI